MPQVHGLRPADAQKEHRQRLIVETIIIKNQKHPVQKPKDDETTHSHSEARLNSWRDKLLHGKFLSIAEGQPQETERNFQGLVNGELKITSEALMVAAQDKGLPTRNIQAKLITPLIPPNADSVERRMRLYRTS